MKVVVAPVLLVAAAASASSLTQLPLVPHRRLQAERQSNNETVVGGLYQGFGTHYVDLWVGSPNPQRQTVIVDTGSGVTAFPCSECGATQCGQGYHIDDWFRESESTTYEKIPCGSCQAGGHCSHPSHGADGSGECRLKMRYAEGSSWSAFEAKDTVYLGGPHDYALTTTTRVADNQEGTLQAIDPQHAKKASSFELTFGCQTHLERLFITQLADGIMGMYDSPFAFWSQMHKAGVMSSKQFSLCFSRQPLAERSGTEAGAMTMGGYDSRLHTSPIVYAERTGSSFYTVHVRKIYLRHGSGGERTGSEGDAKNATLIPLNVDESKMNYKNVIVDSGTTDTFFTLNIQQEFHNAYKELTGKAYSYAEMSLTHEELLVLPTILIQLSGDSQMNQQLYPDHDDAPGLAGEMDPANPYDVILAIPATHYMEYNAQRGTYKSRFSVKESGGSLLGANAIMGHDVYFDVQHNRIGWAESECDYHGLITNAGFVDTLGGSMTSIKPEIVSSEENTAESPSSLSSSPPDDNKNNNKVTPNTATCSDAFCQGSIAVTALAALAALVVGLMTASKRRRNLEFQVVSTNEIEMNNLEGSEYREPAPAGTGYMDDDLELHEGEVA